MNFLGKRSALAALLILAPLAPACIRHPIAPPEAPRPLDPGPWLAAAPPEDGRQGMDVILESILRGTPALPAEGGESPAGVRWTPASFKDGALEHEHFDGLLYVSASLRLDHPVRAVARADGVTQLFVNGVPQPGDPYRSGGMRIPLAFRAGENRIVAGCLWRGAPPILRIEAVDGEIVFNGNDLTVPDLRAGETVEQYVGIPVLNLLDRPVLDLRAQVLMSDDFEPATMRWPALAPRSVTKIGFRLRPRRPFPEAGRKVIARLRLSSRSLERVYEHEVLLDTVAPTATFRRTFVSRIDGSVQYYAVTPPPVPSPGLALILSLHGASVEAFGQAKAYSPKDWAWVVCPTNRRPFGFDWEDWGRLDALEVLDLASAEFGTDRSRVYLTGHSMGGHGTWNVGVLNAGRFAAIAPSAGWCNFASYGGARSPTGRGTAEAFARAAASSETQDYLSNLAGKGVFILHGDQDDNVPVEQGRMMRDRVKEICPDVVYHEQPGAGHWWDGEASPGADCVDWPPLMEFLRARTLGEGAFRFDFKTSSAWASPTCSYVTVVAAEDSYEDCEVLSRPGILPVFVTGGRYGRMWEAWFTGRRRNDGSFFDSGPSVLARRGLALQTRNVRILRLDGARLLSEGVFNLFVDGGGVSFPDSSFELQRTDGRWVRVESTGKRPGLGGPFKEVFTRPFCFVYPDDAPSRYREYASYLVSVWCIRGNGTACALPASCVSSELAHTHNLIYLGGPCRVASRDVRLPVEWGDVRLSLNGSDFTDAAGAFVYPDRATNRLMAWIGTTLGSEHLLFCLNPFRSGLGLPDYMIWDDDVMRDGWGGALRAGFFDPEWRFDEKLLRRESGF
ncbi:MAG: prolyl oligopeptidase family serine peptidase [Planctomycetes bacterium]|nr:prolyl oligopeptidase family serine peptidase [Planctomycetota bacterium]